ncbi:MAG: PLP-dependent aminotransferase family protein, partial [Acidimicrobiales bacterium]
MEIHLSERSTAAGSSVIRDLLRHAAVPGMISLAGGLPAAELFPIERIAKASDAVLGSLGSHALQYSLTEGIPELREWLAAQPEIAVRAGRSVAIVTGSQQALDLLARVLVDPGDSIVVEDPCYLGALQAFRGAQPKLHGIAVDRDGMRVDLLAEQLAAGLRPRFCYVNPSFQNPTGAVLSAARRQQLVDLADEYGFLIIEDDPYRELRFTDDVVAPLAVLGDRVVRIGTVSKTLAPGLRVGWVSGPDEVINSLVRAKQAADLHTGTFDQYLAFELLSDSEWFSGHLRSVRDYYHHRAGVLVAAVKRHLGESVSFETPSGGMFVWVAMPAGTDTEELLQRTLPK